MIETLGREKEDLTKRLNALQKGWYSDLYDGVL